MARVPAAFALLCSLGVVSAQPQSVLRISVSLPDANGTAVPIANHALLVSDNPPSRTPRRIVSGADGRVDVLLAPGSYIVESERPAAFLGKGYEWVTFVEVDAGKDTALALTAENAEIVPLTAATAAAPARRDPGAEIGQWQASVVTIWSPTARASGFVVDDRGLIATDRRSVTGLQASGSRPPAPDVSRTGQAEFVEVQFSPTLKVPARVLVADPAQDVAIVWVNASALGSSPPIPLTCPAATAPALNTEIAAMTASPSGSGDISYGEITGFQARGLETDLRLSFGEAGGPVFAGNPATLVGLTSARGGEDARRGDAQVVRAGILCEALTAARRRMEETTAPDATPLPTEPLLSLTPPPQQSPSSSPSPAAADAALPRVVSSANFDVAFVTPADVLRARARGDRTGGRSSRAPEAEMRLGRLTDFGAWADYFADAPRVLVVRVTPKLVEGFWMRLAREAARVQGTALPALKDFRTNFLRLTASCGDAPVTPIHPFVLEHAIGDSRVLREGLYVFAPDALGPHCADATFVIVSEQDPDERETLRIDPELLEQVWRDFTPGGAER